MGVDMDWKVPNENWLLKSLVNLILDETITETEREIFVTYKKELELTHNDRAISVSLNQKLSFLAVKQELKPVSVKFLSELSQHYIGNGLGGRDTLLWTP